MGDAPSSRLASGPTALPPKSEVIFERTLSRAKASAQSEAGVIPTARFTEGLHLPCTCIGTMNRLAVPRRRKAPINRTHSRRFALAAEAADHASAFGVRASSAPLFPRQAAIRRPSRF